MNPCLHITANSRLTSVLKTSLLTEQWKTQTVVSTPQVMTLAQWWQQWMQGALFRGELPIEAQPLKRLSTFEAQLIWEKLLQNELDSHPQWTLLNVTATAKQLYQAWCFWVEYFAETAQAEAPFTEDLYLTEEVQLFLKLKPQYEAYLQKHQWSDDVLSRQLELLWFSQSKRQNKLPDSICLHGFDDIPPFMQHWLLLLKQFGCAIEPSHMPQLTEQQFYHYAALNPQDEAQQVAAWCGTQLDRLLQIKPMHQIRIAVVAPDLQEVQYGLTQSLDDVLFQRFGQKLRLQGRTHALYNLSLGQPLSEVPLIQNALQTLRLALLPQQNWHYAEWSKWLTSPYTLGDWYFRHQADVHLRRLQWASFKWPNLLRYLAQKTETRLPKSLIAVLQQTLTEQTSQKSIRQDEFVLQVEQILHQFEWGKLSGNKPLNSNEYQQKEKFMEVLQQFSGLAFSGKTHGVSTWLNWLSRFVSEQIHQPQTLGQVPIQVMGMLEAGGQQFDALWVMNLTDEAWPRPPKPNPFLPMVLQRTHKLPRADASRELVYAQQLTQRLAAVAPISVWSYPKQLGDSVCLPSPLLHSGALASVEQYQPQPYQSLAVNQFETRTEVIWVEDAQAPEVPLGSKVPGGSGVLAAQNRCPLMAFVDYRLGARYALEDVEDGLQSNHQGTLVHAVLESFWREIQTQTALLQLTEEALSHKVAALLSDEMQPLQTQFDLHYLALEQKRIQRLILNWLSLEKKRPLFKVALFEQDYVLEISGILFQIKIDRVDEIIVTDKGSGQKLILDYKTGKASVGDLLKTPIEAPQLAVYLQAFTEEVAGLGYGILHSDEGVRFNSLLEDGSVLCLKGQKEFASMAEKENGDFYGVAWDEFLQALRDEVTTLAETLQQGQAQMTFRREDHLRFAAGLLALRLPEVKLQLAQQGWLNSDVSDVSDEAQYL